jgi:hypothetical protein
MQVIWHGDAVYVGHGYGVLGVGRAGAVDRLEPEPPWPS